MFSVFPVCPSGQKGQTQCHNKAPQFGHTRQPCKSISVINNPIHITNFNFPCHKLSYQSPPKYRWGLMQCCRFRDRTTVCLYLHGTVGKEIVLRHTVTCEPRYNCSQSIVRVYIFTGLGIKVRVKVNSEEWKLSPRAQS